MNKFASRPVQISLLVSISLACLVRWSGQPPERSIAAFLAGVVVLIGVMLLFGVATWHLLWRPLPKGHRVISAELLSPAHSQLLGALVLIAMLNIIIGGMWDEVWHREYGIPFGEDLFWRPHLMLYAGFGLVSLLAFGGLWLTIRNARGTLQQRFRRNPALGMLAMLGGFLLFALPADPIWHIIYGEDITAWSLPHLLLLISNVVIATLGMALVMAAERPRRWRFVLDGTLATPLLLIAVSGLLTILLIVHVAEWDSQGGNAATYFRNLGRPDWLLPVMIMAIGAWLGSMVLHATHRVGAATVAGLLALLTRALFVNLTAAPDITINGWLIVLPALVTLDLLYALYLRNIPPPHWATALCLTLGLTISMPLINQLYRYPQLNLSMLPPILVAVFVVGLPMAWLGRTSGDFVHSHTTTALVSSTDATQPARLQYAIPAAFLGVIAFIVLFVLTATPPA